MTVGASDISDETPDQRDQEDRSSAVAVGQRSPEQRCSTKDSDEQRDEIADSLQADTQIHGDVDKCRLDGSSCKGRHHCVEGDEGEIDTFLGNPSQLWLQKPCDIGTTNPRCAPVVRVCIVCVWDWIELECAMLVEEVLTMLVGQVLDLVGLEMCSNVFERLDTLGARFFDVRIIHCDVRDLAIKDDSCCVGEDT